MSPSIIDTPRGLDEEFSLPIVDRVDSDEHKAAWDGEMKYSHFVIQSFAVFLILENSSASLN